MKGGEEEEATTTRRRRTTTYKLPSVVLRVAACEGCSASGHGHMHKASIRTEDATVNATSTAGSDCWQRRQLRDVANCLAMISFRFHASLILFCFSFLDEKSGAHFYFAFPRAESFSVGVRGSWAWAVDALLTYKNNDSHKTCRLAAAASAAASVAVATNAAPLFHSPTLPLCLSDIAFAIAFAFVNCCCLFGMPATRASCISAAAAAHCRRC